MKLHVVMQLCAQNAIVASRALQFFRNDAFVSLCNHELVRQKCFGALFDALMVSSASVFVLCFDSFKTM